MLALIHELLQTGLITSLDIRGGKAALGKSLPPRPITNGLLSDHGMARTALQGGENTNQRPLAALLNDKQGLRPGHRPKRP